MGDGTKWYVVQTHVHGECRAEEHLSRQGFAVYLPKYSRSRRHARKTEAVIRPLFPRYLFVALDLTRDRWRAVQSTFGVSSLVFSGDKPAPIADKVVSQIRKQEDEKGLVRIQRATFRSGQRIRILDGVFEDAVGTFQRDADNSRVAVLLQLLGREVLTKVPHESIASA